MVINNDNHDHHHRHQQQQQQQQQTFYIYYHYQIYYNFMNFLLNYPETTIRALATSRFARKIIQHLPDLELSDIDKNIIQFYFKRLLLSFFFE
eukprot:UN10712